MNGFSVRVYGFIFLVCKVEGAVIDAQMSYTPTRIQDLQTLDLPTVGSTGIKIYDVMRIFTGDNRFLIVQIHTFLVFQQEIEHERVFCQGIWLYIPGL
jgi:hypothetical protein